MLDVSREHVCVPRGATLSGEFTNTGFIHLTDSSGRCHALILNNAGTIVHSGSADAVTLTNNSRINNLAGGYIYKFTMNNFGAFSGGAGNLFHNEGIIQGASPPALASPVGQSAAAEQGGRRIRGALGNAEAEHERHAGRHVLRPERRESVIRNTSLTVTGTLTGNGPGTVRLEAGGSGSDS